MLKTRKLTPRYYSKESRDFQFIRHLFDAVINYSKMCIDAMSNFPYSKNIDERFLELAAVSLGFITRHEYSSKSLNKLCGSFKDIIKRKGTKEALDFCINLLKNAQGIYEPHEIIITKDENLKIKNYLATGNTSNIPEDLEYYNVKIYIPYNLQDIILLEDVLNYILPAGFTFSIYKTNINPNNEASTTINLGDTFLPSNDKTNKLKYSYISGGISNDTESSTFNTGNINRTVVFGRKGGN